MLVLVLVLSAPTVLAQRVGLRAGWRCGLTRGLLYESIGMLPIWSGGVCSRFALPVQAGYLSCVKNVEIPLGCMKLGSCDLGVFPLQITTLTFVNWDNASYYLLPTTEDHERCISAT